MASMPALVNPHATRPFDPTTTAGTPGRLAPTSRRCPPGAVASGQVSSTRYQVLGTWMSRCMSLASSAAPRAVCGGATAHELLPFMASGCRGLAGPRSGKGGIPGHRARMFACASVGRGGGPGGVPAIGASHSSGPGSRNAARAGGSVSRMRPTIGSRPIAPRCSPMYMKASTRRLSSVRQGAGSARSSRYSMGTAPSASRPSLTPAAYASSRRCSPGDARRSASAATARKRWRRSARSSGSATSPTSSDMSPAAKRRARSIWK